MASFPVYQPVYSVVREPYDLCSVVDNNIFSDVILIDFSKAYDIATYIGLDWCLSERQVSICCAEWCILMPTSCHMWCNTGMDLRYLLCISLGRTLMIGTPADRQLHYVTELYGRVL